MRDLGMSTADDDLNEEQFYRILDTHGDVAYAQAIDPPVTLLTFDGQTIQQVLSSCASANTTTASSDCGVTTTTTTSQQHLHSIPTVATLPIAAQLLSPLDVVANESNGRTDHLKL